MKLFRIYYTNSDTCGNTWASDDPDQFVMAESLKKVWESLKKPRVTSYTIGSQEISFMRTPKGQGYGIWEENPEFTWIEDIDVASGFSSGGFGGTHVEEIDFKQL
jgi:hypothetical protein